MKSFHKFEESLKRGPFEQYISEARSNPHKKALLCAAFASVKRDDESAAEYLQVIHQTKKKIPNDTIFFSKESLQTSSSG